MSLKKKAQQVRQAGYKNSGQDSMLAHITPKEAGLLKLFGGSGRIDPKTKLPHYDDGDNAPGGMGGLGVDPGSGITLGDVAFDGLGDQASGTMGGGLNVDDSGLSIEGAQPDGTPGMGSGGIGLGAAIANPSILEQLMHQGKQSLMHMAIPGLAPTLQAIMSNNPQQTAMQTLGNTVGGLMGGVVAGPIGAAIGAAGLGAGMGNAALGMNPVTPEDATANNAATTASATNFAPHELNQYDPKQGTPVSNTGRNYQSEFLSSFLPGALNTMGQTYLPSVMDSIFGPSTQSSSGGESTSGGSLGSLFSGFNSGNVGNFVSNHLGDIASMAYGLYNSNKQQKQMQSMMSGLQGLYSPNGAYATQLRQNLERQAAQRGTRGDYGGREVALMADLAGKNAGLMPGMMSMQNQMGQLQNQRMMNVLNGFNKMGGWDVVKGGLNRLFPQQQIPTSQPNFLGGGGLDGMGGGGGQQWDFSAALGQPSGG